MSSLLNKQKYRKKQCTNKTYLKQLSYYYESDIGIIKFKYYKYNRDHITLSEVTEKTFVCY